MTTDYERGWNACRDAAVSIANRNVVPEHRGGGLFIEGGNASAQNIAAAIRLLTATTIDLDAHHPSEHVAGSMAERFQLGLRVRRFLRPEVSIEDEAPTDIAPEGTVKEIPAEPCPTCDGKASMMNSGPPDYWSAPCPDCGTKERKP